MMAITTKRISMKMFNMADTAYNGNLMNKLTKIYGWDVKKYNTIVKITLPSEDLSIYYKMF